MEDKITSAKGVNGFLIPSFIDKKVYFRVYDENKDFIDYEIDHTDLEVKIIDNNAVFVNTENKNILTIGKY